MRHILLFIFWSFLVIIDSHTQQKFVCDGTSYISVVEDGLTSFYELAISDNGVEQRAIVTGFDANINAIGYNPKDSLIYGLDTEVNRLYRIWADGTIEGLQYVPLQGDYFAGDIHPNGDRLILLNSDSLAIIYLEKMETPVEYFPISTQIDTVGIFTTDIAYHPITNELFGYDAVLGKLITINDSTGLVDNSAFPKINYNDGIPALFFDPRGELYGIGNDNALQESILFRFNTNSGSVSRASFEGSIGDRDGCSCPFTLKLFQKVKNPFLLPCSSMDIVLTIANLTGREFAGSSLREALPEGYLIDEILFNPFQGNIQSGIGENELIISEMAIPNGVDSIVFSVLVPENDGGKQHEIQAEFSYFESNTNIENTLQSNDLDNSRKNSPTTFFIEEIEDIFDPFIPSVIELCKGDTFVLNLPTSDQVVYDWQDNFQGNSRTFSQSEQIELDIVSNCQESKYQIDIQETNFSISLGADQYIERGDFAILSPEINSLSPVSTFVWNDKDGEISCNNCSSIQIESFEDAKYVLVAENESGCVASDEINILVNQSIFAPNAFSPNGDGINDYFYFLSSYPAVEIRSLQIFNRWGALVHETENSVTNNELQGWNGRINGKEALEGTYFWKAKVVYRARQKLLTGSLVLSK